MKRFIVKKGQFGKYGTCIMINVSSGERAEIIYGYGLTIHQLKLARLDGSLIDVIHGHENPQALENNPFAFSGTLMIPYVGRVLNATYMFKGKTYHLPINTKNGHAIHGLLYNKSWKINRILESNSFSLIEFEHIIKSSEFRGYPFHLKVDVKMTFDLNGLQIETKAENLGNCDLPLSFGWHPYIRVSTGSINEYFLSFSAEELIVLDEINKVPTGEVIPIKKSSLDFRDLKRIGSLIMDNTFRSLKYERGKAYTKIYNSNMDFGVQLWQDRNFSYLNIYTPKHRKSIAIEPLTGAPNCFNAPEFGLKILHPGEKTEATFGIQKIL